MEKKWKKVWKKCVKILIIDPHVFATVAGADRGGGGSRGSVDQSRDAKPGSHPHWGARWCGDQIAIEMVQKLGRHEFVRRVRDVQLRESRVFGQRRLHNFGIDSSAACGGRVRCRLRVRGMWESKGIVRAQMLSHQSMCRNEVFRTLSMLCGVHSPTTNRLWGDLVATNLSKSILTMSYRAFMGEPFT